MAKCIFAFALVALFAYQVLADCNATLSVFSPDCTDSDNPYCVQTNPGVTPPTYGCVACISHCDCGLSEYCSRDPSLGVGTCQSFTPVCNADGCSCRNLATASLTNDNFPDSWKCAAIFTDTSVTPNVKRIDGLGYSMIGACVDGTCYIGHPDFSAGLPDCAAGQGTNSAKQRTIGGHFYYANQVNWAPSEYYQDVAAVWFAIFFCIFLIGLIVQIVSCVVVMRKK